MDQEVAPHPIKDVVLAFSPDGDAVAATTAREKGELRAWSVPAGEEVIAVADVGMMSKLAFSPDGKRLAAVGGAELVRQDGEMTIFVETVPETREATRNVTSYKTETRKVKKTLKDKAGKDCEVEYEETVSVPVTTTEKYSYTTHRTLRTGRPGPWLSPRVEVTTGTATKVVEFHEVVSEFVPRTVIRKGTRTVDGKKEVCECPDTITVTEKKRIKVQRMVCESIQKTLRTGDKVLRVWDRGGKLTFRADEAAPIDAIAWRGDGLRLASATAGPPLSAATCDAVAPMGCPGDNPTATLVKLWHSRTARLVNVLDRDGLIGVSCLAFSPDGLHIAAGLRHQPEVLCWSGESRTLVASRTGHDGAVEDLAYSADGKMLASFSRCGETVRLWDGATGDPLRAVAPAGPASVFAPANLLLTGMSRPGQQGYGGRGPAVWHRDTGEPLRWPDYQTLAAGVTPDGARALVQKVPSYGKFVARPVEVRDAISGKVVSTLAESGEANGTWTLSPGGKLVALQEWGGPTAVPIAAPGQPVPMQPQEQAPPKVRVWDADGGKVLCRRDEVSSAQFNSDGSRVVVLAGGKLLVLDATTGKVVKSIALAKGDGGHGRSMVFLSPDRLLTLGWGGAQVFDLAAGKLLFRSPCANNVYAVSEDGKRLSVLAGSIPIRTSMPPVGQVETREIHFAKIQIYDLTDGRKVRELKVNARYVAEMAFAPDGKLLAYCGHTGPKLADGVIDVLTVEKGERIASYRGHAGSVNRIAFRPDGQVLASGGADRTVRLWRVPALDLEALPDDPPPPPEAMAPVPQPPVRMPPAPVPTPAPPVQKIDAKKVGP